MTAIFDFTPQLLEQTTTVPNSTQLFTKDETPIPRVRLVNLYRPLSVIKTDPKHMAAYNQLCSYDQSATHWFVVSDATCNAIVKFEHVDKKIEGQDCVVCEAMNKYDHEKQQNIMLQIIGEPTVFRNSANEIIDRCINAQSVRFINDDPKNAMIYCNLLAHVLPNRLEKIKNMKNSSTSSTSLHTTTTTTNNTKTGSDENKFQHYSQHDAFKDNLLAQQCHFLSLENSSSGLFLIDESFLNQINQLRGDNEEKVTMEQIHETINYLVHTGHAHGTIDSFFPFPL